MSIKTATPTDWMGVTAMGGSSLWAGDTKKCCPRQRRPSAWWPCPGGSGWGEGGEQTVGAPPLSPRAPPSSLAQSCLRDVASRRTKGLCARIPVAPAASVEAAGATRVRVFLTVPQADQGGGRALRFGRQCRRPRGMGSRGTRLRVLCRGWTLAVACPPSCE